MVTPCTRSPLAVEDLSGLLAVRFIDETDMLSSLWLVGPFELPGRWRATT